MTCYHSKIFSQYITPFFELRLLEWGILDCLQFTRFILDCLLLSGDALQLAKICLCFVPVSLRFVPVYLHFMMIRLRLTPVYLHFMMIYLHFTPVYLQFDCFRHTSTHLLCIYFTILL